jgi:hypothetical protein
MAHAEQVENSTGSTQERQRLPHTSLSKLRKRFSGTLLSLTPTRLGTHRNFLGGILLARKPVEKNLEGLLTCM